MLNSPMPNPNDFGANQPMPFAGQPQLDPNAPQPGPVQAQQQYITSIVESPEIQKAIVSKCTQLKRDWISNAKEKKDIMKKCIRYAHSKLGEGDLLPLPSTNGSDRDNTNNRPQIFLPITRQNLKLIQSQVALALFPDDEDFFRIRSKSARGMALEDNMTEGFKYVLKKAKASNKLGGVVLNAAQTGLFCCKPQITFGSRTEWQLERVPNPETGLLEPQYIEYSVKLDPDIELQPLNPVNFYIDPYESDSQKSKWFYVDRVKIRELQNDDIFINQDKLEALGSQSYSTNSDFYDMSEFNGTSNNPGEIEKSIDYTEYYFPELKVKDPNGKEKVYKNWFVGIAGDKEIVRFHPNLYPKGMNPAVFTSWNFEPGNPYGQGPAEDMMDMQKTINMMQNFMIEDMSRNTNINIATSSVRFDQFNSLVGGVIIAQGTDDFKRIPYDASHQSALQNTIGVLKGEMQLVAGSQASFQGSDNIDVAKTATEMEIYQGMNLSINNQVKQHLASFVEQVLTLMMFLVADSYSEPLQVPIDDQNGNRQFVEVDFSPLKSGDFVVELVSANPSQSKDAQANSLMRLLQAVQSPEQLIISEPVIREIAILNGIKNIDEMLEQVKERVGFVQQQQQAEAAQQANQAAIGQPNVAGNTQAAA